MKRATLDRQTIGRIAGEVLAAEVRGLEGLAPLLASEAFFRVVGLLHECRGRILISGLGKSGLVGQRIAASLRSTGSPSIFIHPVEATHGDLGIVDPDDVAILISKSGGNREVCALTPIFRRLGVPLIGITAVGDSELGHSVDHLLHLEQAEEISSLADVPTVSTTLVQVIGDALTVILCRLKGFTAEDFAFLHPGGILGRKVTLRVADVMHRAEALPVVREEMLLADALLEIMEKRLGMTTVVDAGGRLSGVLTDGDFKRILHEHGGNIEALRVLDVMSRQARVIAADDLLVTALKVMETNQPGAITSLVVVDEIGRPAGVVHIHDCLRAEGRGSSRSAGAGEARA
ncbi:MAG: KpsF/GutQ family sugar-phosphate isomerase [Candidatus Eisenbacteria sp.]|nr:KpsF/GutQ family sugar-phosphate isomerase [Candidatus Eisenbacteria bacterium]